MKEKNFRRDVVRMLAPLSAFAVENEAHDGCPDICTVAGWVEMKLARAPARADTRVAVDLRNSQRIWLRRWRRHGGRAWTLTILMTGVGQLWLLHDGLWASEHLGDVNLETLRGAAVGAWEGSPSAAKLIETITGKRRKSDDDQVLPGT